MSTYDDLIKIRQEDVDKVFSAMNAARSIISEVAHRLMGQHGFPVSALAFQKLGEKRDHFGSLDYTRIDETVHPTKNGGWGCQMFVKLPQMKGGQVTIFLDPEIFITNKETKLSFSSKKSFVICKARSHSTEDIERYVNLMIEELKIAIGPAPDDDPRREKTIGFRITEQGSVQIDQ